MMQKTADIYSASRILASLSIIGSVIGFAYDSLVVAVIGPGTQTDAYFLALGLVSFVPTLFFLASTNSLAPALAGLTPKTSQEIRALLLWLAVGLVCGGLALGLRDELGAMLSSDQRTAADIAKCLAILSCLPVLSAVSEFQRARLLASDKYLPTGWAIVARNLGMSAAAVVVRPTTAVQLCYCIVCGYASQFLIIQLFRPGSAHITKASDSKSSFGGVVASGLGAQALVYGIGYAPTLVERAVAARLGPGLATLFSYSYRIVAMVGSVAITSATVPAVSRLAQEFAAARRDLAQVTFRHVCHASVSLALPAAAFLLFIAFPAGLWLSPQAPEQFAMVLALYGLSLVAQTVSRPWSTIEYARRSQTRVVLMTAAQGLISAIVSLSALVVGWQALLLGPLVGAVGGVVVAMLLTRKEDRQMLLAGFQLDPRWFVRWLLTCTVAAAVAYAVLLAGSTPTYGVVSCMAFSVLVGVTAWRAGLMSRRPQVGGVHLPTPPIP
jgi:peptidoglycan biosynthesis protein MviN/MurJ (putative lipid II flippase)